VGQQDGSFYTDFDRISMVSEFKLEWELRPSGGAVGQQDGSFYTDFDRISTVSELKIRMGVKAQWWGCGPARWLLLHRL